MHTKCEYLNASRSLDDELIISFIVDDEEILRELEELKDIELVMDIDKYREKKSNAANRYFWKLCGEIAIAMGSDKLSTYKWLLWKYGVWSDVLILKEAYPMYAKQFRVVEILDDEYLLDYLDEINVRTYFGVSQYDTKQMSILINGTKEEAQSIGVSTWSDEEIEMLIKAWKGE